MMHAVGLHSALAIKRQRKRRQEQKVARERRFSSNSADSGGVGESRSTCPSPHSSEESNEHHHRDHTHRQNSIKPRKKHPLFYTTSNIGMLHLGIMFLIIGIFLAGAGFVPDDNGDAAGGKNQYARTLIATGFACIIIGLFLILVNHCTTKKEEDDLKDYVEKQLTRSKSGRRLVRDVETGGLKSKDGKPAATHSTQGHGGGQGHHHSAHSWRSQSQSSQQDGDDDAFEPDSVGVASVRQESELSPSSIGPPLSPTLKSLGAPESPPLRSDLERILEEESSYEDEESSRTRSLNQFNKETMSSHSEGCWSETQELLTTRFVCSKH